MGSSLTEIITCVIRQLCCNIEQLALYYKHINPSSNKNEEVFNLVKCCLPADYTIMQLEALTFLLHFCLLDTSQQISFSVNQPLSNSFQNGISGAKPVQIFNNLMHVFMPTPLATVHFSLYLIFLIHAKFMLWTNYYICKSCRKQAAQKIKLALPNNFQVLGKLR